MSATIQLNINGIPATAKQYVGIGKLNVQTVRGEVQACSRDYIVTLQGGVTIVVPEETLKSLVNGSFGVGDAMTQEEKEQFFRDLQPVKSPHEVMEDSGRAAGGLPSTSSVAGEQVEGSTPISTVQPDAPIQNSVNPVAQETDEQRLRREKLEKELAALEGL